MTRSMDTVVDVRVTMDRLRANLPKSVDVAALGVKSKAPFQMLCTREALIWRTEELGRNACEALDRDDFAVAAILARAVMENAVLTWKLMTIIEFRSKYSRDKLNQILMSFLAGSKQWDEAPKPIHINDCLREIENTIPGVTSTYDNLSEIAHPNWMGVAGLYSKNDEVNFITFFGRGFREADRNRNGIIRGLLGSLGVFEYAYNRIADLLPGFLSELESLWPTTNVDGDRAV